MIFNRFILYIVLSFSVLTASGQKLEHAHNLYKKGFYAVAIPEYESFLKKKANPTVKSRLADCYRILNQANKAATIYSQMVVDSTAKAKDIFNYGDVMMMLGKYDSAKYYFKKYIELNPDDERGLQSLKASEDAPTIQPFYKAVNTIPFPQNTEADENAPVFYKHKLLFASDRKQGFKLLKQKNKTTGREYITLWSSDKIKDSVYKKPISFSSKLNNINQNTGSASFTADEKEMFFCRNSDVPDKTNTYNMQIFSAESAGGEKWYNIEKMPFCSNEINYFYPSVSPDGKYLFFVSDKGGGFGGLDIYVSKRTKKGWSKPENLGNNVNTAAHEGFPYADAQGKLYFCSKGHTGFGGFDIFVTQQDSITGAWLKPTNLGTPINSAYDDISLTFSDSTHGAFASPRSGRGDDIFFFSLNQDADTSSKKQESKQGKFLTFYNDAPSNDEDDMKYVQELPEGLNSIHYTYLDTIATTLNRKKSLRKGKIFPLEDINFDSTYTAITPLMSEELDKLAGVISLHRNIIFEIAVHTTPDKGNKETTQKQAEAIVQYLIQQGINPKRLFPKGYGSLKQLPDKRIELKIKEMK